MFMIVRYQTHTEIRKKKNVPLGTITTIMTSFFILTTGTPTQIFHKRIVFCKRERERERDG